MTKGGAGLTRAAAALTHRTIETLKARTAPYRVPDTRCKGLAIRVATSGLKTFDLSFRIKGAGLKRMSLGSFSEVTLDEARDRANALTKAARAGVDLIAKEKAEAAEKVRRLTVAEPDRNLLRQAGAGEAADGARAREPIEASPAIEARHASRRSQAPGFARAVR